MSWIVWEAEAVWFVWAPDWLVTVVMTEAESVLEPSADPLTEAPF